MKMQRAAWVGFVVVLLGAGWGALVRGQDAEEPSARRAQAFMRQKLAYSQNVLEGLTLENYDMILTNGMRMWNMSKSNVWQVIFTDEYETKSAAFRDRVLTMIDAARAKNLSGAQDAYGEVIRGCYDCHKTFFVARRVRRAKE